MLYDQNLGMFLCCKRKLFCCVCVSSDCQALNSECTDSSLYAASIGLPFMCCSL
jgi:hypothetical protein